MTGGETDERSVRPFVLTSGRTRPRSDDLRIETLIVANVVPHHVMGGPELRGIVELSSSPISVAEIAARLHLPVGVVRVLVADLAGNGAVRVQAAPDLSDRAILEKLRDRVSTL